MISGNKNYLTPKKMIFNPGMIGLAAGLIIFLFSVPMPKIISEPIGYIASLNTPLPMIIIGYHLTQSNIFDGLRSLKCVFAILLKTVMFPLCALGAIYACGIRGEMLISSVISCSAPTAAITTMFASKFSADTPLSVNMVSLSTIFSLLSMPCLITLAEKIA